MLLVDTGPIIAAADRSDHHHAACLDLLEQSEGPLITSPLVIAEAAYLLCRKLGPAAEISLFDSIVQGDLIMAELKAATWARIRELADRYKDLPLGGTDASVVALAEQLRTTQVATTDRKHFHVVRPVHVPAFTLLP
ncbi:type II toxin-antitoxin system VapC family toxin [Candidatus Frankia nodulisporulans]|uniref:type II toxin-antitoxin system VapC family toxin n=1 Tax=Candidatus Frankia nodulisporulans TaxID=2060052 RepID=UPI0013D0281C|nr:PIN domain-containing protein [Candidatus Frankia nodulisporulans]